MTFFVTLLFVCFIIIYNILANSSIRSVEYVNGVLVAVNNNIIWVQQGIAVFNIVLLILALEHIDELLKWVIVLVYQQLSGHIIDQQVLVKRVLWHVLKASQVDELLPVILSFDNTLHKPTEVGLAYARNSVDPYDKRLYLRVMKVLLYISPRPDSKVLLVHVFRLVL